MPIHRSLAARNERRHLVDPRHMATWLARRVGDVQARLTPDDDGSLWLLFLEHSDGEVVLATAFDDNLDTRDPQVIANLVRVISTVPSPAVLLVVPRADALPLAADTDLWRELNNTWPTPGTELVDLLVVGAVDYWSARQWAQPCSRPERVRDRI